MSEDRKVGRFFDEEANQYHKSKRGGMASYHKLSAVELQKNLSGRVLSLGGLWAQAELANLKNTDIVVADISVEMLKVYRREGLSVVLSDARNPAFLPESFDHIVFPLIIHHITGNNIDETQSFVDQVINEAFKLLKPNGKIWISEFLVNQFVYTAEKIFSPLVRLLLSKFDIPLVIMHSQGFYYSMLYRHGFKNIEHLNVISNEVSSFDMIQPVIGLPWLVVPRGIYPVKPALITAVKP